MNWTCLTKYSIFQRSQKNLLFLKCFWSVSEEIKIFLGWFEAAASTKGWSTWLKNLILYFFWCERLTMWFKVLEKRSFVRKDKTNKEWQYEAVWRVFAKARRVKVVPLWVFTNYDVFANMLVTIVSPWEFQFFFA